MIPDFDPIPLPAPVWLLKLLLHATFIMHIIPMNVVLGGGFLTVALVWYGRAKQRADISRLAADTAKTIPAAAAATITLGVPPLLFLQVLYGPLFYTSAVLIAWPWLMVVGMLIVGYYSYYFFTLYKDGEGRLLVWPGLIAAFFYLGISFMYSNVMKLMIQPERFGPMFAEKAGGLMLHFGDPAFWPRWLHFFVGAVAVSGVLIMVIGLVFRRKEPDYGNLAIRIGGLTFVITTLVQMTVGVWHLLALRREVMLAFLGGDSTATAYLVVAIVTALVAMLLILRAAKGKSPLGMTISGGVFLLVTIVLMVLMRSFVRTAYLGEKYIVTARDVAPNWFVVGIFFMLLAGGLAIVGWMLHAGITRKGLDQPAG
jgi:hypothetical protein